ncbi:type I-U CRISPR-associated protein Csb2 [Motiliproteus sp. SC1-56]|uniref:type I-G CRISPR-associated protein Csb2 n=1 Tax=Motiliproteus sp. SC1-56 TaxID=2799565 RepID=UPI001A8E5B43|nr:type I-U CRISPR-associated protein Csb2 [Motiliproteus sp. SC1-56]
MLTIAIHFPAGRYHATPWGKHVNEADVEWPPSPWRLLRALLATWHRKGDQTRFSQAQLEQLFERLASEPPRFALPPARQAHTRHYMPGAGNKTSLVFDAFAVMHKFARLIVQWPRVELNNEDEALLDDLLAKLGYLGRAESWVTAERLNGWDGHFDAFPGDDRLTEDGLAREPTTLLAPLSAADWRQQRDALLQNTDIKSVKGKKGVALQATLPEPLVEALELDTGALQAVGWNAPPAAQQVIYYRPYHALSGRIPRQAESRQSLPIQQARLQLVGKPLPRVEDTLRVAEAFRSALIHTLDQRLGVAVPPLISGHDLPAENRHAHAFFLPEDADADGRIDHLLLHVPGGIDADVLRALDIMNRLWMGKTGEWRLLLDTKGDALGQLSNQGQVWESLTPYLHPWHCKRGFDVEAQLLRECRLRGLPEPTIERLESIPLGRAKRPMRPVQFQRFRRRRGLQQPDRRGSFLRLSFAEPVTGPLVLGFGCHFGLGMFGSKD